MRIWICRLVVLGLLAVVVVAGCGGGDSGSPPDAVPATRASATPTPGTDGPPNELDDYVRRCERSADDWRDAVVNYPERLSGDMGEELTYESVVDIRRDPPPPRETIPDADDPRAEPVKVRCRLAARLVAVSDTVDIRADGSASEDGWRSQAWSPSGVLEWSWTVEPQAPGDQRVRLELAPAVEGIPAPESYANTNRVTYESTIDADASVLQRVWYWFQTDWNLVKAIAAALAAALRATLAFSETVKERVRRLMGRRD